MQTGGSTHLVNNPRGVGKFGFHLRIQEQPKTTSKIIRKFRNGDISLLQRRVMDFVALRRRKKMLRKDATEQKKKTKNSCRQAKGGVVVWVATQPPSAKFTEDIRGKRGKMQAIRPNPKQD